ncbi:MAG: glycosyltransferase family 4 protein [Nitrospiraceae bacterium]
MRIGIDANPMLGDRGGVGWHTYHLVRALVDLQETFDCVCYVRPGSMQPERAEIWMRDPRLHWRQAGRVMMPWRGSWDRLDVFHGPNFRLRTTGRFGGIVTVHDLWLDRRPEYSPKLFGQWGAFRRNKRTMERARKVITVSQFSAREISALYELPSQQIAVIPNGVSEDFAPTRDHQAMEALRHRLSIRSGAFILFVGGADPRKNHRAFLHAAAQRLNKLGNRMLVLVGDQSHRFGDYQETIRALGLGGQVVCTGRLTRADLRLLYSHADLFVFPSLYEGFGMPVLEAMACGAPTITSNTSALPEVAGDAAWLVDPTNTEELGDAMVKMLDDEGLRGTLRVKGYERVKQFTWNRAAEQTLSIYREFCI